MIAAISYGSIAGCTNGAVSKPYDAQPAYTVAVADAPDLVGFKVSLKSHDKRKLCLTLEQWPSENGLLSGSDRAELETSARIIRAKGVDFGYCLGGCGKIEIKPYSTLHGFISYSVFGDPSKIGRLASKQLLFRVRPFLCE
jgi:hypothetical protein